MCKNLNVSTGNSWMGGKIREEKHAYAGGVMYKDEIIRRAYFMKDDGKIPS